MRIDSYMVKGNATLFDGTVVETGQATADLRLDKGTEITMSTSSRGTLYRNRLVLQRGESELAANSSFQLEANGLRVTPNETNSRGVVSLRAGNTVEVAALNGSFGVTNDHGVLLASVRPGHALSFAIQAGVAPTSNLFSGEGVISFENGHYYFESLEGKFELIGKDFKRYVGTKVHISGTVQGSAITGAALLTGAALPVAVSSIGVVGGAGISATTGLIIAGTVVAAGAGVGVGISVANQSATPASR
jgi:hypothetical protein